MRWLILAMAASMITIILFAAGVSKIMSMIDGPSAIPVVEGPYRRAEIWECRCKEAK